MDPLRKLGVKINQYSFLYAWKGMELVNVLCYQQHLPWMLETYPYSQVVHIRAILGLDEIDQRVDAVLHSW